MGAKALGMSLALTVLFASASPAFSQQAPPSSEKAKQTETLVNKAASLIDSKGRTVFAEFRKKDSEWFHGETYFSSTT